MDVHFVDNVQQTQQTQHVSEGTCSHNTRANEDAGEAAAKKYTKTGHT